MFRDAKRDKQRKRLCSGRCSRKATAFLNPDVNLPTELKVFSEDHRAGPSDKEIEGYMCLDVPLIERSMLHEVMRLTCMSISESVHAHPHSHAAPQEHRTRWCQSFHSIGDTGACTVISPVFYRPIGAIAAKGTEVVPTNDGARL